MGHFQRKFQTEGSVAHHKNIGQKSRVIALSCGMKIHSALFGLVTEHACETDGRTNGITTANTALA